MLDLMKVDMANFAVSSIRPHLMQQSAEYERNKFQEFLEKQPSKETFPHCIIENYISGKAKAKPEYSFGFLAFINPSTIPAQHQMRALDVAETT